MTAKTPTPNRSLQPTNTSLSATKSSLQVNHKEPSSSSLSALLFPNDTLETSSQPAASPDEDSYSSSATLEYHHSSSQSIHTSDASINTSDVSTPTSSSSPHSKSTVTDVTTTSKQSTTQDDDVMIIIETQDEEEEEEEEEETQGNPRKASRTLLPTTRQVSLHSFLGIPDHGPSQYFYLSLKENASPVATFMDTKPNEIKFKAQFYWKDLHRTITVCSNISNEYAPRQTLTNEGQSRYKPSAIPLLKSHLQKSIRKCQPPLAVKTARELLILDPAALLRRLPIIMFEDVISHFDLPVLMWLVLAVGKGFQLNEELCKWVLGLVDWMALTRVKESIPFAPLEQGLGKRKRWFELGNLDTHEVAELPFQYRHFLYAIGLRRSLGGTSGDMTMLSNALALWYERCTELTTTNPSFPLSKLARHMQEPLPFVESDSLGSLKPNEWDYTAIDFHVSNIIDQWKLRLSGLAYQQIVKSLQGTKSSVEDVLMHIMWKYGGSVNYKEVIQVPCSLMTDKESSLSSMFAVDSEQERWMSRLWNEHKQDLTSIAKHILQRYLEKS